MKNFENIEKLVDFMFEKLDDENDMVSVISNKEMTVDIMQELLNYEDVTINSCEIDYATDYDREYIVSLYADRECGVWYVNIAKSYYKENGYLAPGGYVLFHEDVNSKALVDMQNNKFMPLNDHDWFVIGEDETVDDYDDTNDVSTKAVKTDDKPSTSTKENYFINGKPTTKEEFEKAYSDMEDKYLDNIKDMLLRYSSLMDDWNNLMRLFY